MNLNDIKMNYLADNSINWYPKEAKQANQAVN